MPWSDAVGMRNFLIHGYLLEDLEVVWRTVELNLPRVKASIVGALGR